MERKKVSVRTCNNKVIGYYSGYYTEGGLYVYLNPEVCCVVNTYIFAKKKLSKLLQNRNKDNFTQRQNLIKFLKNIENSFCLNPL